MKHLSRFFCYFLRLGPERLPHSPVPYHPRFNLRNNVIEVS